MTTRPLTLALAAILGSFVTAQDKGIQPAATPEAAAPSRLSSSVGKASIDDGPTSYPRFCLPKNCLYYAGDFDTNYSGANGIFNSNYDNGELVAQAWVGVKPDHDVTVTGATFVELVGDSGIHLVNPTSFTIQVGIKAGQAGKTVCSTSGTATATPYGYSQVLSVAITIKKLSTPCKLKKGKLYYVNLLPTSDDTYGYLWNVPPNPQNHYGWKSDRNHCYYNSPAFGYYYVTCDSRGEFSELSIALTGVND